MSLSEIVQCAPFRQNAPRPLSSYEWGVVQTAMARAMNQTQFGVGNTTEPRDLVLAMQVQTCPAWKQSSFGPPPCVATFWYKCFAAWYAGFDPLSRMKIRADVAMGLLCQPNAPWAGCTPAARGAGMADVWEGGPQQVDGSIGVGGALEYCASYRDRTVYAPVRGRELVKIFQQLGPGGVPPGLVQMAEAAPALFLDRDFLLGVQAKKHIPPEVLLGQASPVGLALQVLEDVALIWGPGQGASVLDFFKGPIDPQKLAGLLGALSPDLLGAAVAAAPAVLQQYGPLMTGLLGAAGQILGGGGFKGFGSYGGFGAVHPGLAQPGTPSNTGIRLLDVPVSGLGKEPAPPLPPGTKTVGIGDTGKALLLGAAAAAVALVLVIAVVARD